MPLGGWVPNRLSLGLGYRVTVELGHYSVRIVRYLYLLRFYQGDDFADRCSSKLLDWQASPESIGNRLTRLEDGEEEGEFGTEGKVTIESEHIERLDG